MKTASQNTKPSYEAALSLRIWHHAIVGDEITSGLGLSPALLSDVGTRRRTPTGRALDGVHTQTYWLYEFNMPKRTKVECGIAKALQALDSKTKFLKHVSSTGGRCELFVGVFLENNAGIELDGNLLGQLADAGLRLSFDVYLPDGSTAPITGLNPPESIKQ